MVIEEIRIKVMTTSINFVDLVSLTQGCRISPV